MSLISQSFVLHIFFSYFRVGFFIRSLPYDSQFSPTCNLGSLLGPSKVSVFSQAQYLVILLSLCQITGGHTTHPPIERLLPPTGIELTPFQNSAIKVAGLHHCMACSLYQASNLVKRVSSNALEIKCYNIVSIENQKVERGK